MIIKVKKLWSSIIGITLFPFIFVLEHRSYDQALINHEKIHLRQQLECLIVFFYVIYILHYLYNLIALGSRKQAYRNICFEKEAYKYQHNLKYLKFVTATGTLGTALTGTGTTSDPYLMTLTSPDTNTQNTYTAGTGLGLSSFEFSANVNAGSSRFNQAVPNSPQRRFNNNFGSSITYAKVWKDKPYNLSISANHQQNVNLKFIQIN